MMFTGRKLRILAALFISSMFSLGCSVNEQLQGYLGSVGQKPVLTLSHTAQIEGTDAVVTFTLSKPLTKELVVPFNLTNGTATATDYTAVTGNITFAVAQTSASLTVATALDTIYEGNESFNVNLTMPSAVTGAATHAVTILDDDTAPVIEFATAASNIFEDSTSNLDIVINITGNFERSQAVTYTVANVSASNLDYTMVSGVVTFASGATTHTLSLDPLDDLATESTEVLTLTLSTPTGGATLGGQQVHTVSIFDDESLPHFNFAATASSVREGVATAAVVVTLSSADAAQTTVDYALTGTATGAGTDYTLTGGTLTFAAGDTSKTLSVSIANDVTPEVAETIVLTLSNAQGGQADLGSDVVHTLSIIDNEHVWTGATADGLWSTAGNWLTGDVPQNNENVLFDNTCGVNCNVNADSVAPGINLTLAATYTGTMTVPDFILINTFSIASGTININDNAAFGDFTQSGGVINFNGNAVDIETIIFQGTSITVTGGTTNFSPDVDKVYLTGSPALTVTAPTWDIGVIQTVGNSLNLNIVGSLTISGEYRAFMTGGNLNGGELILKGNYIGSPWSGGTASLTFTGSADQTVSANPSAPGNWPDGKITVNKSGGRILQSTLSAINLNGAGQDLEILSGTWDMQGSALTINDRLDMSAGTHLYRGCATLTHPSTGVIAGTVHSGKDVAIDVADASVTEGGNLEFVISSTPANCQASTFTYATSDSTATVGDLDYTAVNTTATIGSGATSITVTVATGNDSTPEPNEALTMTLSGFNDAADAGDITAIGTISDNDGGATNNITVSALATSGITSDDFNAQISFTGDDNANAVLTLYWCNATAEPGCNPETANAPLQGSLVMTRNSPSAGNYAATISNLAYPNFAGDTLNVRVVAADTDGVAGSPLDTTLQLLPVLDVEEQARIEGQSFNMVVNINRVTAIDVTFSYSTGDVTTTEGSDYAGISGTATIAAGQTGITLPAVISSDDGLNESTEYFNLTISGASMATIRASSSMGRILDNDPGLAWQKGLNSIIYEMDVQPDGKPIVVGGFTAWDDTKNMSMARINLDGSEDVSFYTSGGFNNNVRTVTRQPDGKIIAGGDFTSYKGTAIARVARIHADGSLDTTFNPGAGANNSVTKIVVLPDNKILLGGVFSSFGGVAANGIIKLNSDGSVDTSFSPGTGAGSVTSIHPFNDGKILITGYFETYDGVSRNRIAKINYNGSLDTSFDPGTGFDSGISDSIILADGKIITVGYYDFYNGISSKRITKINSDGTLDTGFNTGVSANYGIYTAAELSGGKIVIGGYFDNFAGTNVGHIARLNSDGTFDSSFNPGSGANDSVNLIKILPDGRLLIIGDFLAYNGNSAGSNIAIISSDGVLDSSFAPSAAPGGSVYDINLLSNNQILLGGNFETYGGISRRRVARFNSDYTLDTTFNPGTGASSIVYDVKVLSSGKIAIGGKFTFYNGVSQNYLARLNADGSLDTTFNTGVGPNYTVWALDRQTDDKIVIGGAFSSYAGVGRNRIARVNTNGTLDTSFNPGSGASNLVEDVAVQSDGKVLIGGQFDTYNGVAKTRFLRANSDGSIDSSFVSTGPGGGFWPMVYDIEIINNKILVGGSFTSFNGAARGNIALLNSNGALDTSFAPTVGTNASVLALTGQQDGKFLIAGNFNTFAGVPREKFARVNSNGSLDTGFVVGTGYDGWVESIQVNKNGDILTGGHFLTYNGQEVSRFHAQSAASELSFSSNLSNSALMYDGFTITTGYFGDSNNNGVVTLYWCNVTDSPGCDPQVPNGSSQGSVVMSRSGSGNGTYTGTISGLNAPNDPSDSFNVRVVAVDPDGATGTPLNTTIELLPTLNIADSIVTEGLTVAPVISLASGPYSGGNIIFNWATSDGTAKQLGADPDDDYTTGSGTGTIVSGQTSFTLPAIATKDDSDVEGSQYFTITLSGLSSNVVAGNLIGQVTINDSDSAAVISVSDPTPVTEGANVNFVVTLSMPALSPVVFDYTTQFGSAKDLTSDPDDDYTTIAGTATIGSGQTSITLPTVTTKDDSNIEPSEFFYMTISNVTNIARDGNDLQGLATLNDNDALGIDDTTLLALNIYYFDQYYFDATVTHIGDENTNADLTLWYCNARILPGCDPVTQGYSVTMIRRSNVFSGSSMLFPHAYISGDTINVAVTATDPDGVSNSPVVNSFVIPRYLDVMDAAVMEGDTAQVVVNLNKSSPTDIIFNYETVSDTAAAGDYVTTSGLATISAGNTSVTLPLFSTNTDVASESTEIFKVRLSNITGALGRYYQANIFIVDDDPGRTWDKGVSDNIHKMKMTADNKIILIGSFERWDDKINKGAVRINSDGSEDLSFQLQNPATGYYFAVRPNGKFYYGGTSFLNADGTIDKSSSAPWSVGSNEGYYYDPIRNKLTEAGYSNFIRRLSDGSLDTTFDPGVGFNSSVNMLVDAGSDKLYAVGSFTFYNGAIANRVAKINSDGSLDTTFNTGLGANSEVKRLRVQADGKVILSGWFTTFNGLTRNRIVRLNTDGTEDTTFTVGTGANEVIHDTIVLSSGKVLIGGYFTTYAGQPANRLARLNTDGTLDTTFNIGTAADSTVFRLHELRSGKILVLGSFKTFNGVPKGKIVRLNSDGTIDSTFGGSGFSKISTPMIYEQSDDRVIVYDQYANSYNGTIVNNIVRIDTDGNRDTTFNTGTGFNDFPYEISIDSNGKILVGGYFTLFNGASQNGMVRLNSDGTKDTTFNVGSGFNNTVLRIETLPDQKVLVAGQFTNFNGVSNRNRIIRLNSDGSYDSTFTPGTGPNNAVSGMYLTPDNKMLISGSFTQYNSVTMGRAARINANGTLDTTFNFTTGANSVVDSISMDWKNRIYLTGNFSSINGVAQKYFARVNEVGVLDTSYAVGNTTYGDELMFRGDGRIFRYDSDTYLMDYNGLRIKNYQAYPLRTAIQDALGNLYVAGAFTKFDGLNAWRYLKIPAINDVSFGEIEIPAVNNNSFSVRVGFHGDANSNSTATLWYCNNTDTPGCNPTSGVSLALTKSGFYNGAFTGNVNGLTSPYDPLDQLNLRVVVTDGENILFAPSDTTLILLNTPPPDPSSFVANQVSSTRINLSWASGGGTTSDYRVAYAAGAIAPADCASGTQISETLISGTSYSVTGLSANTQYSFRVCAIDGSTPTQVSSGLTASATTEVSSPTLSVADLNVSEGSGAQFVITITSAVGQDVVFDWATVNGTAIAGGTNPDNDYIATVGTATITSGLTSVTLPAINALADGSVELSEYFTVTVSNIFWATPGDIIGQATILDTDTVPTISIADPPSDNEGRSLPLVVSLSGPRAAGSVVFSYNSVNGTATSGTDYTALAGTATILPGQTVLTLPNLVTIDDLNIEGTEYLTLQLSGLSNVSLPGSDLIADLAILDNEAVGSDAITISNLVLSSITDSSISATVNFVDDDNESAVLTMYWCNEFIRPGCDPQVSNPPLQGSVVMTRGAGVFTATQSFSYPNYAGEAINIRIVAADVDGSTGGPLNSQAQLLPVLDVVETAAVEGQPLIFVIKQNRISLNQVTIAYATASGSASQVGGLDYTGSSGTATIPAGADSVTLPAIATANDALGESTEIFTVTISSPTNAALRFNTAQGYIVDNDPGPSRGRGFDSYVNAIKPFSDGKTLVVGDFSRWDSELNRSFARVNPNGSENLSAFAGKGFEGTLNQVQLLPNGKYLIAASLDYNGNPFKYDGTVIPYMARLNADGSLDSTFNIGTGPNAWVRGFVIQKDARIIVYGGFNSYNGVTKKGFARINSDGSLANDFDVGINGVGSADSIGEQRDGSLVYIGYIQNCAGKTYICRLNVNGAPDATFNTAGGPNGGISLLFMLDDDRFIITGGFISYGGQSRIRMALANRDGNNEPGFAPGAGFDTWVSTAIKQADGKFIFGGQFYSYNGKVSPRLVRVNTDGSYDSTFNIGSGADAEVSELIDDGNGKIVIAGNFEKFNGQKAVRIARIQSDGSLDTTFVTGSGFSSSPIFAFKEANGNFAYWGRFASYGGHWSSRVARLTTSGVIDTTFNAGEGANNEVVMADIYNDQKIILGGYFDEFNGHTVPYLVRLNQDGSYDSSFVMGVGPNGGVTCVGALSDGKALISGWFSTYDRKNKSTFARINQDGSLDTTFNAGLGPDSDVERFRFMPDGSIMAIGYFTSYDGYDRESIVRVNSEGRLDPTFDAGVGTDDDVLTVVQQPDGKYLVGGWFEKFAGVEAHGLVRLNNDGSIDNSVNFRTMMPLYGFAGDIFLLNDGMALIGGYFSSFAGEAYNNLVRVALDGTVDTSFNIGSGPDSSIYSMAVHDDGRTYVGGWFDDFNNEGSAGGHLLYPPEYISVGSLATSDVTASSFKVTAGYFGDGVGDATAILYYCNNTDSPGCNPMSGSSTSVTINGVGHNTMFVTVSGLSAPNNPGDTLSIRLVVTDPDGVQGSPLNATVQLAP